MSIPVLEKIHSFPATKKNTFYFNIAGISSQVVYNELQINLNSDNSQIYLQRINEFRYQHILPENTLVNGEKYYAVIRTYDLNQNILGESEPVFFYCFSEPILTIPTIVNDEVNAQTVTFTGNYTQTENELLQSYKFLLYDSNQILIAQSSDIYSDVISYEFSELENGILYYVELKILTINELQSTTGLIQFIPNYIAPRLGSVLELENLPNEASISVRCNIIRIFGISEIEPVLYINNEMSDLTNNVVNFTEGFNIMGNFTIQMWVKNIVDNEQFFRLKANDNSFIELRYIDQKIHLYKYLNINYILQHVVTDEIILNDNIIFISFKQIDGLYDIYVENIS